MNKIGERGTPLSLRVDFLRVVFPTFFERVPHCKLRERESVRGKEEVWRNRRHRACRLEDQPSVADGQLGDAVREHGVPLPRGVREQIALHWFESGAPRNERCVDWWGLASVGTECRSCLVVSATRSKKSPSVAAPFVG